MINEGEDVQKGMKCRTGTHHPHDLSCAKGRKGITTPKKKERGTDHNISLVTVRVIQGAVMAANDKVAIEDVLALTIGMHFERRFANEEIKSELKANAMDVLKTMKSLWLRSSGTAPKWYGEDSDVVLAIRVHFGNCFDCQRIVRTLEDSNGDVLATMRVLHDETEQKATPPTTTSTVPNGCSMCCPKL
jgi:hypothetical protein